MSQEANRLNIELIQRIQIIGELREENEKLKHEIKVQNQHNELIKKAKDSNKRMDDFLDGQRRVKNYT